jgi:hypothetical protein
MDFLQGEPGSCNETHETNTLDGNQVASVEAERVSRISEVADLEPTTNAAINTELNVSGAPVVSVKYISYQLYPQLTARASVFPCERRI